VTKQSHADIINEICKKIKDRDVQAAKDIVNKKVPGFGETGGDEYIQKINQRAIKYKFTPAGRRQARNSMMLRE